MIRWDLQQFNGEKTEQPTAKKLQEARNKGQIARSPELGSGLVLLIGLLGLYLIGGYFVDTLTSYMKIQFSMHLMNEWTMGEAHHLFMDSLLLVAKLSLPIMGVVGLIAFISQFVQVGSVFTVEPLIPKFSKLNPITGLKRLFSLKSIVELFKSLIKVTMIGYISYSSIVGQWTKISNLIRLDASEMLREIGDIAFSIMWKSALVLCALAVLDYVYQRYEHQKSLRMSKQEIKDEFKNSDGNPLIKNKIKERGRAIAMRRMMQEVPKADVVITNPTHFAVALRYEANEMDAPQVVAKGMDELAQRIKQIARENDVILVENRLLAQSLYKSVEVGDIVPDQLFQAVAEVLAYVYRLKRKA